VTAPDEAPVSTIVARCVYVPVPVKTFEYVKVVEPEPAGMARFGAQVPSPKQNWRVVGAADKGTAVVQMANPDELVVCAGG